MEKEELFVKLSRGIHEKFKRIQEKVKENPEKSENSRKIDECIRNLRENLLIFEENVMEIQVNWGCTCWNFNEFRRKQSNLEFSWKNFNEIFFEIPLQFSEEIEGKIMGNLIEPTSMNHWIEIPGQLKNERILWISKEKLGKSSWDNWKLLENSWGNFEGKGRMCWKWSVVQRKSKEKINEAILTYDGLGTGLKPSFFPFKLQSSFWYSFDFPSFSEFSFSFYSISVFPRIKPTVIWENLVQSSLWKTLEKPENSKYKQQGISDEPW
jgi:hypothetical protein